jgi:hypothetical protein
MPGRSPPSLPHPPNTDTPAPHRFSTAGSNPSNPSCRIRPDQQDQNAPAGHTDDAGSDSFAGMPLFVLHVQCCLSRQFFHLERPLLLWAHTFDYDDDSDDDDDVDYAKCQCVLVGHAPDASHPLYWLHESSAEKIEDLISSVISYFDASQASKAKSYRSFRFEAFV